MRFIDLTARRFGRLVVVERSGYKGEAIAWLCKCDCGNEAIVIGKSLRRGATRSCGCLHSDELIERNIKHEQSGTRLYNIWGLMMQRCYNPKTKCYLDYGGRGITVCSEWRKDFQAFRDWSMKNGYADNLTIDRINNDKGYSPNNCRWSTRKEQANNTRRNHYISYNGESHTLAEWAEIIGMLPDTLECRIRRGWDTTKALTTPLKKTSEKGTSTNRFGKVHFNIYKLED